MRRRSITTALLAMATCAAGAYAAELLAANKATSPHPPQTAPGKTEDAAHEAGKTSPAEPAKPGEKPDDKSAGAKPADPKKPPEATVWPAQDIELAKARCTQLLKSLDAVTSPEAPFRSGECGAPAPVRLVSIGKNPAVTFDPPALVTCDLVAGLEKWMRTSVQPAARKYLGGPVAKIETMSDYSCRNAYGRVANKLSEHGRANAVDIRGFVTLKGEPAYVLEGWGRTKRDVVKDLNEARTAAARADAIKAEAERVEAERAALAAAAEASKAKSAGAAMPLKVPGKGETVIEKSVTGMAVTTHPDRQQPSLGLAPTHLGGPGDKDNIRDKDKIRAQKRPGTVPSETAKLPPIDPATVAPPAPTTKLSMFLHETHDAACRIFGTTLGPEANEAHRNHFHVDMAERKQSNICD